MNEIKLNVTGVCKNCPDFDPKIKIQQPYIDQDGHFVETQYKSWCGHEAVCYRLKEEREGGGW